MRISNLSVFFIALGATACGTDPVADGTLGESRAAVTLSSTSADGLVSLTMTSSSGSDTAGATDTYTWTATNLATIPLTGVTLGSHWGDWCGGFNCTPPGPGLVSAGPGCASQGADEIPVDAHFGEWCTPVTGVTLAPGASVSGTVTLRPGAGGPPDYSTYSLYNDPVTGRQLSPPQSPLIRNSQVVAPAPTDLQLSGSASTGSPAVGASYTYTYQLRNAGPFGTFGGITFTDALPASLAFVSAAVSPPSAIAPGGACRAVGQTVTCPLGELQSGSGQATITVTVTAPTTPQAIANTASVAVVAPQTDASLANNSVTITVTSR